MNLVSYCYTQDLRRDWKSMLNWLVDVSQSNAFVVKSICITNRKESTAFRDTGKTLWYINDRNQFVRECIQRSTGQVVLVAQYNGQPVNIGVDKDSNCVFVSILESNKDDFANLERDLFAVNSEHSESE